MAEEKIVEVHLANKENDGHNNIGIFVFQGNNNILISALHKMKKSR